MVILGGAVGSLLFHLAGASPLLSLLSGLIVGIGVRWHDVARQVRDDAQILHELHTLSAADYASEYSELVIVTGARRVMMVDDLEDEGPGVLLDADDADLVYLHGQRLPSFISDGVCYTSVRAVRTPHARQLLSVEFFGEEIEISDSLSIASLPVKVLHECTLVPRSALPRESQSQMSRP